MIYLTTELSNTGTSYHPTGDIHLSINTFKAGIEHFKLSKPDSPNGFWQLSEHILKRISDKSERVKYLLANRDVALRQNILI